MSACPELSLLGQYYNTEQQVLESLSKQHLRQPIPLIKSPPPPPPQSQSYNGQNNGGSGGSEYIIQSMNHMITPPIYGQQYSTINIHSRLLSPPLSIISSASSLSTIKTTPLAAPYSRGNSNSSFAVPNNTHSSWNITWLVFMNEKWVPFDVTNQVKLEQTLTVCGTFVDISDSHFPGVKRVRVFPRNYYLSYLGVKYRLSRVMQPDAYLDHVSVAQVKQQQTLRSMSEDDNKLKNRVWEM
ncbi:hypothetical protein K501DRAFT_286069 [Backusella circina FSU 941]|nr:hypothetical protein K501DRAFT_286069 [Backusella circina FSU 941]